jgi:biotin operon repressor
MSASDMSAALRVRGLSIIERLVFTYLCDRERNRLCWPSGEEMAWELEISRRAVVNAIKRLEELEYISVDRRYRQTSVYRIVSVPVANRFRIVKAAMKGESPAHYDCAPDAQCAPDAHCAPDAKRAPDAPQTPVYCANDDIFSVHEVRIESPKKESPKKESPKVLRAQARATRLPEDWQPNEKHIALAKTLGFTQLTFEREADKMRDWAAAKGAKCIDWNARFRVWLRNAMPPTKINNAAPASSVFRRAM